jgi:hypothetical protein
MRRTRLVLAAAALALLAAEPAVAAHTPSTFGVARKGPLDVVSGILTTHRLVDMRGVWTNESISCLAWRKLDVRVVVEYMAPGSSTATRVRRTRIRNVQNCAEGGPNTGFTFRAARLGLACPNGAWKPGRYNLSTTTKHVATGTIAIATLDWTNRARC